MGLRPGDVWREKVREVRSVLSTCDQFTYFFLMSRVKKQGDDRNDVWDSAYEDKCVGTYPCIELSWTLTFDYQQVHMWPDAGVRVLTLIMYTGTRH